MSQCKCRKLIINKGGLRSPPSDGKINERAEKIYNLNTYSCIIFLLSQVHRVLIPEDEVKRCSPRRSLAFFVDPDVSALITCMDGSNKYPPITSGEWMQYRLKETYKY